MFDVSLGEFVLILLIAMIFIGPENLPRVARKIGSFIGQIREAIFSVRQEVENNEDTAQVFNEMHQTVSELANAVNIRKVVREMGAPLMNSPQRPGVESSPDNMVEAPGEGASKEPSPLEDAQSGEGDGVEHDGMSGGGDGDISKSGVPLEIMEEKSTKTLDRTFRKVH
ncbi:twin-arginine translocase TatA/TatE family subunit [Myxococcota bacterium]|nr:twin-arginine translocase TatA/TatE family subunit [Myxococcota bacterium]MBU1535975.1 twin-arginine translocase TatA/TatE family subunit [Myxococcota bacterium]